MQCDGPELTGFTKREKEVICQLLTNYGMPVTSDSKNDYQFIRNKMIEIMKSEVVVVVEEEKNDQPEEEKNEETITEKWEDDEDNEASKSRKVPTIINTVTQKEDEQAGEKNILQNLERFVQRIRMVA